MAASWEADTGQWLHNKLGSTDDLWSGSSICSQLTREKLLNITECFHSLQPHVKVKLMLSFLHLPKRNVEQWKSELEEILLAAQEDSDQWVAMIGDVLKTYPVTGSLNTDVDESHTFFHEVLVELRKLVKKCQDVGGMLPMECPYLCRNAMASIAGQHPQPGKYFTLKRKPKSAALRAEILQKSAEAANNLKRNCGTTVPVKIRSFAKKMDDTTPLRGIPSSRTASIGGFVRSSTLTGRFGGNSTIGQKSGVAVQKEGGIKLLEITEQPIGSKEAKRRKKQADQEAIEQQKKSEVSPVPSALMPDYAVGLLAPSLDDLDKIDQTTSSAASSSISYLPIVPGSASSASTTTLPLTANPTFSAIPKLSTGPPTTITMLGGGGTNNMATFLARDQLQQQLQAAASGTVLLGGGMGIRLSQGANVTMPIVSGTAASPFTKLDVRLVPSMTPTTTMTSPIITGIRPNSGPSLFTGPGLTPGAGLVLTRLNTPAASGDGPSQPSSAAVVSQVVPNTDNQQKKPGLQLTKEQMVEAQEMFRTSNKVTRPEKALILGFMAGSRDNPVPAQGDILNIRLSEMCESVQHPDGTFRPMTVETYFQMNYATGEWKRVRKIREREPDAEQTEF